MKNELVSFKGTREAIHIILDDEAPYSQLLTELLQKLDENRRFFAGANVVIQCGKRELDEYERQEIESVLEEQYALKVMRFVGQEDLVKQDSVSKLKTLFVQRTIRSGQAINFDGHVVVVGDVNAGAHITATGNICVLGAIRGVVHAGAAGDREAFVAGNCFVAPHVQLRIADIIVRAPEDEAGRSSGPEIATVDGDHIVVHSIGSPGLF